MDLLLGRWDLTVGEGTESFPSWVELAPAGGRFVGRFGSSRPLRDVTLEGEQVTFRLPKQYESRDSEMEFTGSLVGKTLLGTTTSDEGHEVPWSGVRAPALVRPSAPIWGEIFSLIGPGLDGWKPRSQDLKNCWSIQDGMLYNSAAGSDIVTDECFQDFRLVAEYKYPANSNSGIYLRGRYEVQILDDFGHAPGVGTSGAIYGFIAPRENAVRRFDEWNVAEITLLGRYVTIVLNGVTIIDNQEIPGITGGALDSDEASPGPLFLQGDHGPVVFRKLDVAVAGLNA